MQRCLKGFGTGSMLTDDIKDMNYPGLHIDDWSKDKPRLLAMSAIELAFDAEY
jgi:hypothetical protein